MRNVDAMELQEKRRSATANRPRMQVHPKKSVRLGGIAKAQRIRGQVEAFRYAVSRNVGYRQWVERGRRW
jgi:hypothetical protein